MVFRFFCAACDRPRSCFGRRLCSRMMCRLIRLFFSLSLCLSEILALCDTATTAVSPWRPFLFSRIFAWCATFFAPYSGRQSRRKQNRVMRFYLYCCLLFVFFFLFLALVLADICLTLLSTIDLFFSLGCRQVDPKNECNNLVGD